MGLSHLQGLEFLYETRLFPEPEYTFKHALTHEVAYSSLLQERRRALHCPPPPSCMALGIPLDAASWERTPLVVRQLVVQLHTVIQQQAVQITPFEARASQHSQNSDRPPSSAPPYAKHPVRAGGQGRPGDKPGPPGHRQARLEPTDVIEVRPKARRCGQREFPATTPYHTHRVIEPPEIHMQVTHVVLHEARCPQCGRLPNAPLPEEYSPRLPRSPGAGVWRARRRLAPLTQALLDLVLFEFTP
jgi:Family of unknown function (DUF6444)